MHREPAQNIFHPNIQFACATTAALFVSERGVQTDCPAFRRLACEDAGEVQRR